LPDHSLDSSWRNHASWLAPAYAVGGGGFGLLEEVERNKANGTPVDPIKLVLSTARGAAYGALLAKHPLVMADLLLMAHAKPTESFEPLRHLSAGFLAGTLFSRAPLLMAGAASTYALEYGIYGRAQPLELLDSPHNYNFYLFPTSFGLGLMAFNGLGWVPLAAGFAHAVFADEKSQIPRSESE